MQNNSLLPLFFLKKDLIKHIHSSAVALTKPTQFQDFCYFILPSSSCKATLCRKKRYMCYIKIGCDSEAGVFWVAHSDGVYAIICYENVFWLECGSRNFSTLFCAPSKKFRNV